MNRSSLVTAAIALTIVGSGTTYAQGLIARPRHATLNLAAGVSAWDFTDKGTSIILAARLDRPLGSQWLLGEGSLATFTTDEQTGSTRYLITEVHVQLQVPRAIAPYVGVGLGVFSHVGGDAQRDASPTNAAAAGVRVWGVIPRGLIRAELRLRGVGGGPTGSALETTGGVGWTF